MDAASLRASIADDVSRIGRVLAAAPLSHVTACPGWDVIALVRHHGAILRWATDLVRTGSPTGPPGDSGPDEEGALGGWYANAGADLIAALASTDPDRPCWTFGPAPGTTAFWTARQALEAAIHRHDAEGAVGTAGPIARELAAEGITEVVETMFPRQVELGRTPRPAGPIELVATDLARTWTIPGGDGGIARLEGSAADLLLLLWRRGTPASLRLRTTGPPSRDDELSATRFAP